MWLNIAGRHLLIAMGLTSETRLRPDRGLLPIMAGLLAASATAVAAADEAGELFSRQIRPLLATRCLECHSGPRPEGGLDLSRRETLAKGGDSGPPLDAANPQAGLLWRRVADDEMPPEHPLTDAEKTLLRQWLDAGATWTGAAAIDYLKYSSTNRAGYDWWSLQPLHPTGVPAVEHSSWPRSDLDRFVLARLERADLAPSPPASARTLIRRVTIDLTGLPPTPEEVTAFTQNPTDQAYAALIDRLLESPAYGERWGRHWLDVVRFGESDGFERNQPRKNAWPYRDWVIEALNADLPYDEFVRQQLAGDLLTGGTAGAASSGFLVAGVHNTVVGQSERMKRLARQDELEEIVATVGQSFLGLTINCARCHDHKFDPIRSEEYYRVISALDGVRHGEREISLPETTARLQTVQTKMAGLRQARREIDAAARAAILARRNASATHNSPIERPRPLASWEFEGDLRDSIGKLHGKAFGHARVEQGALIVDGVDSYVQAGPLDKDLHAKTLEAWVLLDNLQQRGGGVVSVETSDGGVFDAIVFGEREPGRWMAGSNGFVRTQSFGGENEQAAAGEPVHVAIVYRRDGTITGYRNGLPYGRPYKSGHTSFPAGTSQVVFGLRHHQPGGNRMLAGRILRANLYDTALSADAVAASAGVENQYVSAAAIIKSLSPAKRAERESLSAELAGLEAAARELAGQAKRKMYTVTPGTPARMRVHLRGSVTDLGQEVAPGGVAAVRGVDPGFDLPVDAGDAERRRRLADWISSERNPLLARVIVNRVWHYHFGVGIVDTPNDLGFNGGRPSHPDLLDWLALNFRDGGFRLKQLHRQIVTSATYRQASTLNPRALAKDADNRLLWRYSPRRVEAEVLRDAMLVAAGQMNRQAGGPGFEDVTITYNSGTTYYEPIDSSEPALQRRTVYRFTPRGGRSALLDTFDCPDPSAAAPRRSVTTTPLQALSLLNNAFVLRMSKQLADRVERQVGTDLTQQVRQAWLYTVARLPDDDELRASRQLAAEHGLPMLARALFNTNEFVVIE